MATDLYTQLRLALIKTMWVPRSYKLSVTTDEVQLQVLLYNPLKHVAVPLGLALPLASFPEETDDSYGGIAEAACTAFCATITELATNPTSSINQPNKNS